jgi:hypothetical protein
MGTVGYSRSTLGSDASNNPTTLVGGVAAGPPEAVPLPPTQRIRYLAGALLVVVLLVLAATSLLRRTWYLPISTPTTGSFSAGPISEYFSAGQTLALSDAPVSRIDLAISRSGDRAAGVLVEIVDPRTDRSLRSGRVELRAGRHWYSFHFPPIDPATLEGPLYIRVRADPDRPLFDADGVVVFYDRGDQLPGGAMLARDELAPSDWDLAIRTYRPVPLRTLAGQIYNMTASSPVRFTLTIGAALFATAILARFVGKTGGQDTRTLLVAAIFLSAATLVIVLTFDVWIDPSVVTIGVALN